MSTPAHHARVAALFHEALDRPAHSRAPWLAAHHEEEAVVAEVRAMLAHHGEDSPLDLPLLDRQAELPDPMIGERVGPWRVTALLGHGGMGTVYRAERADADGPEGFRQTCALKIVRPGVGPGFRERFVRERALLASLDHPGVARLLDGGVTDRGWPYLAMELVEGEPITRYAESHDLGVPARLGLFVEACEAVAYAHRRLVVHRDLKPEHVLVAKREGGRARGEGRDPTSPFPLSSSPSVKLLDFGVAKLIGDEEESLTRTGRGPLTPAYAAPEQVAGEPVTTATDVYALGLVLYELLAGRRPYEVSALTAAEAERVIREGVPKRPSEVAPPRRARALRGDLDAAVLKALAKEPERRYPSAEALAGDLRRHLDGVPVRARPATAGYRARRFVRRHRAGVLATLLVALAVLGGAAAALVGERDARRAQAEAEEQTERAEAVAGFLEQILRAPNSRWYVDAEAKGPDTPIRAVLAEAAARIDRDFADQPDLRADLHHVLGDTYVGLGMGEEAGRHHRETLAIRESLYMAPHPALAEALYYAAAYLHPTDVRIELAALERAADMLRQRPEGNNLPFILQELADFRLALGQPEEALALAREGVAFVDETFVPGHDGHRYRDRIRTALAIEAVHAALDLGEDVRAVRWMAMADSAAAFVGATETPWHGLARGRLLVASGRYEEAEPFLLVARGERTAFRQGGRAVMEEYLPGRAAAALVAVYEATERPALAEAERRALAPHLASRDSLRRAAR